MNHNIGDLPFLLPTPSEDSLVNILMINLGYNSQLKNDIYHCVENISGGDTCVIMNIVKAS